MKAFRVHLNGKKLCCAGLQSNGGISVSLGYSHQEDENAQLPVISYLLVQGVDEDRNEFLDWIEKDIKLNDTLEITFIETEATDVPKRKPCIDK
jgi:hypothetical protein